MMITENELKILDSLRDKKENLEDLLKSFENRYVKTGIGLVSFYDDLKSSPSTNEDYSQLFHNMFQDLIKKFTEETIVEIKTRIKHIDVELEKYITKQ